MTYDSIHQVATMARNELGVVTEMEDGAYRGWVDRDLWDEETEAEFEWLESKYGIDYSVRDLGDDQVEFTFGHQE